MPVLLMACAAGIVVLSSGADTPSLDRAAPPSDSAQEDKAGNSNVGRLIRIPLPIRGTVDERVRRTVDQVLAELPQGGQRPVIVFEFWPSAEDGGRGSEFGDSHDLARYLSNRLGRVRTVAYVPRSIKGHAVLVALACEELIMDADAEIGDAGIDETTIDPTLRRGYTEIADRRRMMPAALALGMLDASLQVYKATTPGGVRYVLEEELETLRGETTLQQLDTIVAKDEMANFSGRQLRLELGIVSHLVADRRELASALGLSANQLELDPSLGGQWRPIRIDLRGPVTSQSVTRVQRGIQDRMRGESVNFVCLWIDSPGGSPVDSVRLANFLTGLDSSQVRTVAYVAGEARADAALIALACDHVVVHSSAVVGGSGAYQMDQGEIAAVTQSIRELAREKSRRWSLIAAMIDPGLSVYRFSMRGTNTVEYFCEDELAEQSDPTRWVRGEEVTAVGKPFSAEGSRAESLGLAQKTVESYDEFKQFYDLDKDPSFVEPSWAHEFVDALAAPHVAATLLFFASFALIAELMSPGIGAGAFVSALCFALYFWSQFLHGTAGWLEVVLFLTGLTCLLVEFLVLPGFGIFGLGGGALVVASVVLASQTFVFPQNEYQFNQMPRSLLMLATAGGGVMAGLFVLRRYVDRAPLLRRIMLTPPRGDELDDLGRRESLVDWNHLLGEQGVTTTPLTPAGKARFGEHFVDVISDGEAIPRGARVTVVDVMGNRVLVQPVEQPMSP